MLGFAFLLVLGIILYFIFENYGELWGLIVSMILNTIFVLITTGAFSIFAGVIMGLLYGGIWDLSWQKTNSFGWYLLAPGIIFGAYHIIRLII